jgi:hypothetical protein
MASSQSYEEAGEDYREKMGDELGPIFHRLWNECALLHMRWDDYADMFGTDQEDFDLMNESAAGFFRGVQDTTWEWILLKLCHFADRDRIGYRRTLSLETMRLTKAAQSVPNINELVKSAREKCQFAMDWRNRSVAHSDLDHQLDRSLKPLEPASRSDVREALKRIDSVLKAVSIHYTDSDIIFDGAGHKWGRTLLYELKAFSILKNERKLRIENGTPREGDFDYRKWMGLD